MSTPFGGKQLTLLHIDHCFCSLLRTLLFLSCVVGNRMQNHSGLFFPNVIRVRIKDSTKVWDCGKFRCK